MKKSHHLKLFLPLCILFLLLICIKPVYASGTIVKEGKKAVTGSWIENEKKNIFSFKYDGSSVYLFECDFEFVEYGDDNTNHKKDKMIMGVTNGKGKTVCSINAYAGSSMYIVSGVDVKYNDADSLMKIGEKYTYFVKYVGENENKYRVHYSIKKYNGCADYVKLPKKISMKTGEYKTIETKPTPYNSLAFGEWMSGDYDIADVDDLGTVHAKKPGIVTIYFSIGDKVESCEVYIKLADPYINYKTCKCTRGYKFKLQIVNSVGKVSWSSSNNNIASVSSNGTVTAKNIGKCKITGTYKKKKFICDIDVQYRNPNFSAIIEDYNTRDNYFIVSYKNNGDKPLTISKYARAEDRDYRVYDRNLYLSSAVTLQPKEKKTLRFYVSGGLTWYNHKDFDIKYKFTYDGCTYNAIVRSYGYTNSSIFEKNNKWYYTYIS